MLGIAGSLFWGASFRDEINQMLIQEMDSRLQSGKVFPERHRIMWYPWVPVQQTNIFATLKEKQASIVMAESAMVYWSELDETKPFESLALKALQNLQVGPAERRIAALTELADAYEVDGAIHFSTPACRHENGSFRLIGDALKENGVPVLNIEADMTDERNYSAEKTTAGLESFFEILQTSTA
jgi:benzoyl-CoA reductase/2-hydroxyglutaryl-CoA dehydratase subunit BcrC/BadD/HgdB